MVKVKKYFRRVLSGCSPTILKPFTDNVVRHFGFAEIVCDAMHNIVSYCFYFSYERGAKSGQQPRSCGSFWLTALRFYRFVPLYSVLISGRLF